MGNDVRDVILSNICYTDLVYGRINKKLSSDMSKKEIEEMVIAIIADKESTVLKKGKNYYVTNKHYLKSITINSNTFRVITISNF